MSLAGHESTAGDPQDPPASPTSSTNLQPGRFEIRAIARAPIVPKWGELAFLTDFQMKLQLAPV